jgi:hypothetical protein
VVTRSSTAPDACGCGDLLSTSFDTSGCVLACYSAAGFSRELRDKADASLALITLDDIYSGGS